MRASLPRVSPALRKVAHWPNRYTAKGPAGNIFRAVSLVPDEAHRVIGLVSQQYFGAEHLLDFHATSDHALSRAQIELVATKVSEHNQCFY